MSECSTTHKGGCGGKIEILEDGRVFDPELEAMIGNKIDYEAWAPWEETYMDTYYGRKGITPDMISKRLGRTKCSVSQKAERMGITNRRRKEERPENL